MSNFLVLIKGKGKKKKKEKPSQMRGSKKKMDLNPICGKKPMISINLKKKGKLEEPEDNYKKKLRLKSLITQWCHSTIKKVWGYCPQHWKSK